MGDVHQNDKETVTTHYTVDYLSEQKLDLTVTVDGSYSVRYVYTLSEDRLSAEFTYAEGTERGEGGENPASKHAESTPRPLISCLNFGIIRKTRSPG